jgi:hypothetical protein
MQERMRRLAAELRDLGAIVVTWQELTNPGFLFEPIAKAIEHSGIVLADTTHGNPNVLFEVGFAIARNKHVVLLRDENVAKPVDLRPLDLVRRVPYTTREAIMRFLTEVDLSGSTISEQAGLGNSPGGTGRLYFLPSRTGGDFNQSVWGVCQESSFLARMIDVRETDYDSLNSQGKSIAEADVFVTLLVSKETKDYWLNNAQAMLFAGLACGLDKDYAVLILEPYRRLVDIGEHLIRFESEAQAERQLERWLKGTAALRLRSPKPKKVIAPAKSPLTGLFMGSLDARADFDLSAYFIETPEFKQAESGRRHLFVGSKGSGKTANFEILRERLAGRNVATVTIAPAEFEFPHLAAVFDEHLSLAHWEFVYGSFWRFILYTELLRAIRDKFLGHLLRESGDGKEYAKELVRWFDGNEHLLTMDLASRVNFVLRNITEIRTGDEEKLKRLEELLQLARMYEVDRHLQEFTRQFEIRLLIDDLDRNWSPVNPSAHRLIVTLLNEIQSLMTNQGGAVKPAVFLRRDVFRWLEQNDPELLKRDPAFLTWSPEGLQLLIAARIAAHTKRRENDPDALWGLVFPPFTHGERTADFILTRTLLRPRDVVVFCQQAVEWAQRAGRVSVDEEDVLTAWENSGENILTQTQTEYQYQYPYLGDFVLTFFEQPITSRWADVCARLEERAEKLAQHAEWIAAARTNPLRLLEVLYETGAVGVETAGGSVWFASIRPFADIAPTLPADFAVTVHPAFQRYLRNSHPLPDKPGGAG